MKRILNNILQDIRQGRNIESYLTILLLLVVAVMDVFNLSNEDWLTEATLAVLALLVYDRIQTKRSLKDVNTSLQKIKQGHIFEISNELDILQINRRIESAKTIDWLAFNNVKTVNIFRSHIVKCLSEGGEIRMLIYDESGVLLQEMETDPTLSKKRYKSGAGLTIQYCYENILNKVERGKIEFRLLDSRPPYRLTMYNRDHENGYLRIHILKPSISPQAATIAWFREDDPEWFRFFAEQYETLWQNSRKLPNK